VVKIGTQNQNWSSNRQRFLPPLECKVIVNSNLSDFVVNDFHLNVKHVLIEHNNLIKVNFSKKIVGSAAPQELLNNRHDSKPYNNNILFCLNTFCADCFLL
jgi:hypothetical protein